jgi:diacylglycerol kinase (ATP)
VTAPSEALLTTGVDRWQRALVIANPAASAASHNLVNEVTAACRPHAGEVSVYWTRYAGDAQRAASECAADLVVAVGGDGTIREVAEGIFRNPTTRPALLPVPAGGGNSVCRGVWGGEDRAGILDAAFDPARSRVRRLDLLHAAELGRTALLGVSTGLLAEILIAARDESADLVGRDRYYAAAPRALAAMTGYPCRVTVDDTKIFEGRASLINVGGGRYRAWALQLLPHSVLDDGLADVCVLAEMSGTELSEFAPTVMAGKHLDDPRVSHARGRQVVIERTDARPLVIEYDGEVEEASVERLTIDVQPGALPFVAPTVPIAG